MVESIINQGNPPELLQFLDPDLFSPIDNMGLEKFLSMYLCAICTGIVIKPLECNSKPCVSLFCGKCIADLRNDK